MLGCSNPACSHSDGRFPTDYDIKPSKCGGCKGALEPAVYCCTGCQKAHWSVHKNVCPSRIGAKKPNENAAWEDPYRKASDGSYHMGKLELVTWEFEDEDGDKLGWGGCLINESEELKAQYEGEMNFSKKKLIKKWENAFRWTCCGMSGSEGIHGCDHHGDLSNPRPCTCDYCRSGRGLPDELMKVSTHRHGLTSLRRGPDPRYGYPCLDDLAEDPGVD